MLRGSPFKISSRKKLIVLAAVAVLLPIWLLTYTQYRSLLELEKKTKGAYKENLRQNLLDVERKMEEKVEDIAHRALLPAAENIRLSKKETAAQFEKYFSAVRQTQPEVEQIFVISNPGVENEKDAYGYVYSNILFEYKNSDFKKNADVREILSAFDEASKMRNFLGASRRFLFRQSGCSECSTDEKPGRETYLFYPLLNFETQKPIGFAGLIVSENYVRDEMLSPIVAEVLNSRDRIIPKHVKIAVSVGDGNGREIFTNLPGQHQYIIESDFNRPFTDWKAKIGFKNFGLDSLARDGFLQSSAASVLVLLFLIAGIFLTFRAISREMRLAQMKSAFVSNVSHELKTPLSLISLFAEILELGRVKDEEKKREYYRIIGEEIRRLNKLIDNILDFSKIEAGRKAYKFAEADIGEVVENVISVYQHQIINSGFQLKTNIPENLPTISIDRDAISQAILNLLDNAVKYSAETKEISVDVKTQDSFLRIEITDRGTGIPRAEQKKIFEKFYRAGNGLIHDVKGSGLGLSLVKHIIDAHRGKISVESEAGKGSRFIIRLPLAPTAANRKSSNSTAGEIYKVAENSNH
ncbi:MAG TPA: HAMP domain-containing sensor histidine kinase [Pyrinomonadaceae bacterium]|jgi:signal transduction histidine kinase